MGVLGKTIRRIECLRTGRMEEYKLYVKCQNDLASDIERYSKSVRSFTSQIEAERKKDAPNELKIARLENELNRWKYFLAEAKLAIRYVRPNTKEDIEYRNAMADTFSDELRKVLSPKIDLRFHGTPLYFAEEILRTKQLSSTADRFDGYIKSTNRVGEISVSDRHTVNETIDIFSDVAAYYRSQPCGCIFALLPKDEQDATSIPYSIQNVDLSKNPEQLFGIFTTPENIERIKQDMKKAGLDPNKVFTFEEFLNEVKIKSEVLDRKDAFTYKVDTPMISKEPKSSQNTPINETIVDDKETDEINY